MRTLIFCAMASGLIFSINSFAQNSPRLWRDDVPTTKATIDLSDVPNVYAIYKCVITNDLVVKHLPYMVRDLGWGVDSTRQFIYGLGYVESREDPFVIRVNDLDRPERNANGFLQILQIMVNERARKTGKPTFSASELADWLRASSETYLRSLDVLNDVAKAHRWKTYAEIGARWYCWNCSNESVREERMANVLASIHEFWKLEWEGTACVLNCNMTPWRIDEH